MQTKLVSGVVDTEQSAVVEAILRKCVHCGFCNATCPTYQLRGDELDGPRGRIYQMKQFFEGADANAEMLKHLDRCLTCRACETTCPSGVQYSHLLEIGKHSIEQALPRPVWDRWRRKLIVRLINSGWLFALALRVGRACAWLLPAKYKRALPPRQAPLARSRRAHARKMLMLSGCVQPTLAPNTNILAANLLDRLGIEAIEPAGKACCGAAALHTSEAEFGLRQVRQLIDLWWPHIEAGVEAVVVTASGCGVSVKDYTRLLADDPQYAAKAARVSALYRDLIEVIETEVDRLDACGEGRRVAVHTPCTLQHGLRLNGRVEQLLHRLGYQICAVQDANLCCGSAGTYSMLQPAMSAQLRKNKLRALSCDEPEIIATANIGCQLQLAQGSRIPVKHWIELV